MHGGEALYALGDLADDAVLWLNAQMLAHLVMQGPRQ
jgi:hypothetical protein